MALSLGIHAGSRISIGDSMLKVLAIKDGTTITLDVDGKEFVIDDQERTQILPEVFVSCGLFGDVRATSKSSKLAIEAPRRIQINRIKHYARSV